MRDGREEHGLRVFDRLRRSTEGEVKITIRSTAAFYIYKIYIDYEQE